MSVTLVTGGAGFIGSHLVDRLVASGHTVRVLDALEPQVHRGSNGFRHPDAEYVVGSVTSREMVERCLSDVGSVVHLGAQVGVGQSMYEPSRYVRDNTLGTAVLLEAVAERRADVSALVVASSMSIYGEGQYACDACGTDDADVERSPEALRFHRWDPTCVRCASTTRPTPTPESKALRAESVYAMTKRHQEELVLLFGRAYGIRAIALRFFNVYGPRQSLSNPYTGVAAIFASRLLNGRPPLVFEDGLQSRDFVHVSDIVRAIELALSNERVGDIALNIGTGVPVTVLEVAEVLSNELGLHITPEVVNRFRQGDIRHCIASIVQARELLGYEPAVSFRDGIRELATWIVEAGAHADDQVEQSTAELATRGLVL